MTHRRRLLMALTSWHSLAVVTGQVYGPFLIVGPLTVMTNWHNEFKKFTPEMPCILYHGARARASRRTAVPPSRRGVAARSRSTRGERLNRTVRTNERLLSQSKARQGRAAIGPAHRCGCGVAAGSKADRAALRAQYLKNAGQKTFPIVRAQSPTAATSESLVHSHARASRYASAGAAAVPPDIPPQPGLVHAVGCVC